MLDSLFYAFMTILKVLFNVTIIDVILLDYCNDGPKNLVNKIERWHGPLEYARSTTDCIVAKLEIKVKEEYGLFFFLLGPGIGRALLYNG